MLVPEKASAASIMPPGSSTEVDGEVPLEDRALQASDYAGMLHDELNKLHSDMKTSSKHAKAREVALQKNLDELADKLSKEEFEKN